MRRSSRTSKNAPKSALLGFRPVKNKKARGTRNSFISLPVGYSIGRTGAKPAPEAIDLGITRENGGDRLSRKLFQVASVTDQQITLKLMPSASNTRFLYQALVQVHRKGKLVPQSVENDLTLLLGDQLILLKRFKFDVEMSATDNPQTHTSHPATGVSSILSTPSSSKTDTTAIMSTPEVLVAEEQPFVPFRPSWTFPTTNLPKRENVAIGSHAASLPTEPAISENANEEQDDLEEDASNVSEVHVSLANVCWKAINSPSPHVGAGYMTIIAGVTENKQVFPLKFCKDLVTLLTLGPQTDGRAIYDGYRLQVAWNAVQAFRAQPGMYERLAQTAGQGYWKTVLDHMRTLPYVKEDRKTEQEEQVVALSQSVNLHVSSVRLFDCLLEDALLREASNKEEEGNTPYLLQDIRNYGEKTVCKAAANSLAFVWLQHGERISQGGELGGTVQELTRLLTKVLCRLAGMVEEEQRHIFSMIRDSWEMQYEQCPRREKKSVLDMKRLKLDWICGFDDLEAQVALGKLVGVSREYNRMIKG